MSKHRGTRLVSLQRLLAVAVAALACAAPVADAKDKDKESSGPSKHAVKRAQKLSPDLQEVVRKRPSKRVVAIVVFAPGTAQRDAERTIRRLHGKVGSSLPLIHAVSASFPAKTAATLAQRAAVRGVILNSVVEPQGPAKAPLIPSGNLQAAYPFSLRTDEIWNSYGLTGKGVGVAVIDTGIAGNMVDFRVRGSSASRVVESAVINPEALHAGDSYGHGTHVAGIIAGNGTNRAGTDPLYGHYAGIAPEANLISIKASSENGDTTLLDVIYGLQFAVDHKADWNIRVVNLSLESTVAQPYSLDPLSAAVEAAWMKGLVVVAAAGNRGLAADAVSYSPGNDPYVISVGATDDRGTRDKEDDIPAPWTSRGTTQDGFYKPDIYAPGSRIVAPLAPGSLFTNMCGSCIVSGEYIRAGGTSMSAPMVSGAVALILQAKPQLTPDQVKGMLIAYGRKLPSDAFPKEVRSVAPYDVISALKSGKNPNLTIANQGLTPHPLIDVSTQQIDYSRASWRRASWRVADGEYRAAWSRASWRCDCSTLSDGSVDPARASWRRATWATEWNK